MIKAEELRKGNWYQWSKYASMGIGYDIIKDGADIDRYNQLREPIHLSEDILLKAKLKVYDVGDVKVYYIDHEKYHGIKFKKYAKEETIYFDSSILSRPIEYVHIFQNFVFFLTGTELTIDLT